jgi:hypothetical protein
LVDPPLATELRFERSDRQAIRLHTAIAATLADELVDDDASLGSLDLAALADRNSMLPERDLTLDVTFDGTPPASPN